MNPETAKLLSELVKVVGLVLVIWLFLKYSKPPY